MTEKQKEQCGRIIDKTAMAAGCCNLVPIPAVGAVADYGMFTAMTISLAKVFGQSLTEAAARGIALAAIKRLAARFVIGCFAREFGRLAPLVGPIVSGSLSFAMARTVGWWIAGELSRRTICAAQARVANK